MNWAELDARINFKSKTRSDAILKRHKYKYISKLVYDVYFVEKLSIRHTSTKIGVSPQALTYWMSKMGFERRPQGGNNKNEKLLDPAVKAKIIDMEKTHTIKQTADICECSIQTIRKTWGRIGNHKPKKIKVAIKKYKEKEPDAMIRGLSTAASRGVDPEKWKGYAIEFEKARWRAHRGEKPTPMPRWMIRMGDYAGI